MLPVIVLLGRPNVGKSTLFNFLTRSRDALVADFPGLTRDRKYGYGKVGPAPYVVVDTGGVSGLAEGLDELTAEQSLKALQEADYVLFMVDGRAGMTTDDQELAAILRRSGKPATLVLNKTEGMQAERVAPEFYELGLGQPVLVSSAHGDGIYDLIGSVLETLPANTTEESEPSADAISVAVVGRPNTGKSTLINRILGEERVVASDVPGTTRDAVEVDFERDGRSYRLIDTAGIRRRARVKEVVEKFSIIKTLQAVDRAEVVLLLVDAREGVSEQDVSLLGLVLERGRALVIAVNKWDGLSPDQRDAVRSELDRRLSFVNFAKIHFISALHGTGVGNLFKSVNRAYEAATRDLSTPELNRILEQAAVEHPPPLVRGRRIKLRYAHQGGKRPPLIVIHGNQVERIPGTYRRYLANTYQKQLDLWGTPVRIEFRKGENPYEGRRNKLTPRQVAKRRRLMRHVKRKD
ncbi:MAG: ribosome biogenesis GTPase Der [Pseudomonadota bacterium]|nr:ribosome biogenesis GTPase Der [Pseudomonadota bacterium]